MSRPVTLTLTLLAGLALGYALGVTLPSVIWRRPLTKRSRRPSTLGGPSPTDLRVVNGVAGLIGNTPLVRIPSLSEATGCEIYAKAEFLNPGGSPKDRVALSMVETAEAHGELRPHTASCLFEGTVGSTGISLAMIARAKGYLCHIVLPDDQAAEKYALLEKFCAEVEKVRPVSIVNQDHFVNVARRRACVYDGQGDLDGGHRGYFADQFDNLANYRAHYQSTGPEIWTQTHGNLDAFVSGAGTGGTLAGTALYLKQHHPSLRVVLADPQGSGLFHRIKHGVMYAPEEAEGTRRRHQVDTVVEGMGINRVTRNLAQVLVPGLAHSHNGGVPGTPWVDDAVRVTDQEAVWMARYLVNREGLFIGSTAAVNCVAAVRTALTLGPGHTIVTILCDSGQRHLTKFWNDDYLRAQGLDVTFPDDLDFLGADA
ncbi:Cysteine synthase 2 [Tieghemiomyces parasiticus]|uniref:cysteine synthase n=1 Tax=Tieghemiomyces parasiticus TaxID=78921 RepID=A0A9W8A0H6_9FUNG|nr:Cysteine synthase 2 [Tieghemiomyces parasiticus]